MSGPGPDAGETSPVRVPTGPGRAETRERGSRFLALCLPAADADRAVGARDRLRREHRDATHHVFAWRGLDEGEVRFDDDGEPAGTAGRPCLGALEAADLRRAAVVVVRWFGGTKLGTGGLARAYGEAARRAADAAPVRRAVRGRRLRVIHGYDDSGAVASVLERSGAVRLDAAWDEAVTLELGVPVERVEALRRALRDATGARAEVEVAEGPVLVPLRG